MDLFSSKAERHEISIDFFTLFRLSFSTSVETVLKRLTSFATHKKIYMPKDPYTTISLTHFKSHKNTAEEIFTVQNRVNLRCL